MVVSPRVQRSNTFDAVSRESSRPAREGVDRARASGAIEELHRLSAAVVRAGSVEEVLEIALDALCGTLGVDRASVLLFDADGAVRTRNRDNKERPIRERSRTGLPARPARESY